MIVGWPVTKQLKQPAANLQCCWFKSCRAIGDFLCSALPYFEGVST